MNDIPGTNGLLQADTQGHVYSRGRKLPTNDRGEYRVELYGPDGTTSVQYMRPMQVTALMQGKPLAVRGFNNASAEAPESPQDATKPQDDTEATEGTQDAAEAATEPQAEPDEVSVSTDGPQEPPGGEEVVQNATLKPLREKGYRLSKREVAEIKWLLNQGHTVEELDARYPCSDSSIERIAAGETYADVEPQAPAE